MRVICGENDPHGNWTMLVKRKGSRYCYRVQLRVGFSLGDGVLVAPLVVAQVKP